MQVNLSFEYIHAEKLSEPQGGGVNLNVQLSFPAAPVSGGEGSLEARFVANITSQPPVLVITLKGVLRASGGRDEIGELRRRLEGGEPDPALIHTLTTYILFEAALLSKELGLPPAIPLPPPRKGGKEPGFSPV